MRTALLLIMMLLSWNTVSSAAEAPKSETTSSDSDHGVERGIMVINEDGLRDELKEEINLYLKENCAIPQGAQQRVEQVTLQMQEFNLDSVHYRYSITIVVTRFGYSDKINLTLNDVSDFNPNRDRIIITNVKSTMGACQ